MIISDLYQTIIKIQKSSSDNTAYYNMDIDTTGVLVTVKLQDFNKVDVNSKSISLTVDKGTFSKVGSSGTLSNNNRTFTDTTSNGVIQVYYSASEWGLVTFTCNETKKHAYVRGVRESIITSFNSTVSMGSGSFVRFSRTGNFVSVEIWGSSSTSFSSGNNKKLCDIPEGFRPDKTIYQHFWNGNFTGHLKVNTDTLSIYAHSSGTPTIDVMLMYMV